MIRHVDVCLIVKDLFKKIGSGGDSIPIKVDSVVLPAVAGFVTTPNGLPYKISLDCKNWPANQLSGMLFRYPDRAEVIYSSTLNTCWARFVVCKELVHLLIDTEPKHFTKNPVALVQEIINKLPSVACVEELNSESLAIVGAVEMLLPWHLRKKMEDMMASGASDYAIALEFRAPEKIVNLVLRSEYGKTSAKSNSAHP